MNKLFGVLMLFAVLLVHFIDCRPIRSSKRLVKVGVQLDNSEKTASASGNTYKLEFTNLSYKLVCQVKFRIELPETATLDEYWNINPIGPTDHHLFTLPVEQLYPGRSFTSARLKLNGVGEPKVTIMDTVDVLSTKPCPTVPIF
ncbi:hypothetical protein niasHT_039941 [Heterodera trifolii]|uniref:Cellulose binding protein n=1 Tax=Heterodera trifolii TaxID=157864 RepID=A0ABD2IBH7_9BILA